MDYEKIGNFLYELRKSRNLTQKELGKRFYVTREAISKWERGISIPDYPSLIAISKFYNITINEILAGEKIDDNNREKIEAVALTILKTSEKKVKRSKLINVVIILSAICLLLLVYFFINYNSIHMYALYGSNDEYCVTDGEVFIHKDNAYLKINMVYSSDREFLNENKDYKLIVYYRGENTNKIKLFDANYVNEIYINLYNYKDLIKEVGIKDIIDNLYLEITLNNEKSTLKLENKLFYSNDLRSMFFKRSEDYYFESLVKIKSLEEPKTVELNKQKYTYNILHDSIMFENEGENIHISYSISTNQIMIKNVQGNIEYSYELKTCLEGNCKKYKKLINAVKKEVEKLEGT